ncbi:MAG: hypothetical protein ACETWE_02820 [Candidatus Bathyarchaeia archaeon]
MKDYPGGYSSYVEISRKNSILRRVTKLRKTIKVNTQKIREKVLDKIQKIFDLAVSTAKGELDAQTIEGVLHCTDNEQHYFWLSRTGIDPVSAP